MALLFPRLPANLIPSQIPLPQTAARELPNAPLKFGDSFHLVSKQVTDAQGYRIQRYPTIFQQPWREMADELPERNFVPCPGRVRKGFSLSVLDRAQQAEEILRGNGKWPPRDGELFVIQIDQDSPPPPPTRPPEDQRGTYFQPSPEEIAWRRGYDEVTKYLQSYSGQVAIFRAQRSGNTIRLLELDRAPFPSASHPGQRVTFGFTDFDGDGFSDIAWLRSGVYPFHAKSNGKAFLPVDDQRMRVARDLNHDGTIDLMESNKTISATATDVYFHAGSLFGPESVGCQTLAPEDFSEFRRILESEEEKFFTYILVRRPNENSGEGSL